MKEKKYELSKETLTRNGVELHRVKALKDFYDVSKGTLGGWLQSEANLSQEGNCWIYDNATACGDAVVRDDAQLKDDAIVCDNACIKGHATANDDAIIADYAVVGGYTHLYNSVVVDGKSALLGTFDVDGCAKITNLVIKEDEDDRINISY